LLREAIEMIDTEILIDVSFLPDQILNSSQFSSDSRRQIGIIWQSYKTEGVFNFIETCKKDLAILCSIERKYAKGSDVIKDDQLEKRIGYKKHHIKTLLDTYRQFFGKTLDRRLLHSFVLHRKVTQTKLYFEGIGIGAADACIGAAACAVYLGRVPHMKFGLCSSDFKNLYKAKNRLVRDKLADLVRKRSDNYLARSNQICSRYPDHIGAPQEGLLGRYYRTLQDSLESFVESERKDFPKELG
jgi:hypothetical protein